MLTKVIGCGLVVCATTAIGMRTGMEYKYRVEELGRLKRVIWHLKGEINYSRNALPDVCFQVAKRVENPYKSWLCCMGESLEKKGYSDLGKLWQMETLAHFEDTHLSRKDVAELADLGYQLGYMDVVRQEETLKWYGARLEETRKPLAEKLEERRRLCTTLGVMSGIFLAILLI